MPKYKVVFRRNLWTYMDIEADDQESAIDKAYEEGLPELCAHCCNAWGNDWQPHQSADDEAEWYSVEDGNGKVLATNDQEYLTHLEHQVESLKKKISELTNEALDRHAN